MEGKRISTKFRENDRVPAFKWTDSVLQLIGQPKSFVGDIHDPDKSQSIEGKGLCEIGSAMRGIPD